MRDVNLCDAYLCVNLFDFKLCDPCDVKLCDVNICNVKLWCNVNLCDGTLFDVASPHAMAIAKKGLEVTSHDCDHAAHDMGHERGMKMFALLQTTQLCLV